MNLSTIKHSGGLIMEGYGVLKPPSIRTMFFGVLCVLEMKGGKRLATDYVESDHNIRGLLSQKKVAL
jgi:hypothetical protein